MPTRSQVTAADLADLLRARNATIWIRTDEEARAEGYVVNAAASASYKPIAWDCAAGACDPVTGKPDDSPTPYGVRRMDIPATDPGTVLEHIRERATREFNPDEPKDVDRRVWIMRDLHKWLEGAVGIQTSRQLRNLARTLHKTVRPRAQAIVIITPSTVDVPAELAGHMTVINWPLPDRDEIAALLDKAISGLPDELQAGAAPNGQRDAAIDAAIGLTGTEAENCYAKSIVRVKRVEPAQVGAEKKRIIAKDGLLQWMDPLPGGFDSVGGLEGVKDWVTSHLVAFSPKARAYGLPTLKGIFLAGVSGCGKTHIAKAIATAFGNWPLIRMDMGALKDKFVGASERNLRKGFDTIESCGRVVVLLDEVEKMLAGATQGAADGGVSADALGALLTWMNDRTSPAFLIATANDVTGFAKTNPEFLRKGRWDEVFFVDLPNMDERVAVLRAALRTNGRDPAKVLVPVSGFDLASIAQATEGFSGAEIASLVPEAMFAAFSDGEREPTLIDLVAAASRCVPLSRTAKERLEEMRAWAQTRARPATIQAAKTERAQTTERALDVD